MHYIQEAEDYYKRATDRLAELREAGSIPEVEARWMLDNILTEIEVAHLAAHIAEVKMTGRQKL